MRCYNCGWNNPDNLTKCEKCNQPLIPETSSNAIAAESADYAQNNLNKTVIVTPGSPVVGNPENFQESDLCPKCHYPLSAGQRFCPNCGFEVRPAGTDELLKKTIVDSSHQSRGCKETVREIPLDLITPDAPDPVSENDEQPQELPSIRLVPMDNFDGKTSNSLDVRGPEMKVVAKDALGIDSSISEEQQIEFSFSGGYWSILSNKTGKSVFVCTANSIRVEPGDIIVIGNRRFRIE